MQLAILLLCAWICTSIFLVSTHAIGSHRIQNHRQTSINKLKALVVLLMTHLLLLGLLPCKPPCGSCIRTGTLSSVYFSTISYSICALLMVGSSASSKIRRKV